ncbi:alpha-D-ribose 1-methylphosphonate 5-triphosphate diphosphatase [Arboricoccus pini]|uniref:Alpha-D-ribose 1-methylphosphonate 5-triphosphate diphosphatase n=1 Tax=Arboricoccus pini TaxID=1963835 RepID=A0A212QQS9_9PROT|nr:alpha-D-ribose 1-methylphosphonate 5-triphosphate diphosphatase [Arboricoccus pini]SNB61693.1 alpha-D-ribose 1-methylphosphonate 5-triphosphate diphosphatase [Arboricoccus pini]
MAPPSMRLRAHRVLLPEGPIRPATLTIEQGFIQEVTEGGTSKAVLLPEDLLLAPAFVDLHGDAFERQIMPRPGVMVDLGVGLLDTDRQLAANGIATAFHGVTWSWEPGLRGTATGRGVMDWLNAASRHLCAEHRIHLRFETHNFAGLDEALRLIETGRIGLLAFNDHTSKMAADALKPSGNIGNAYRAGVPVARFNELALAAAARSTEVPAALKLLAAAALARGIPMLAHDSETPEEWRTFAALGCGVAEFPLNLETARTAVDEGHDVVMGAPNVLRGKSHMGWVSAESLIAAGACTILASDYYYPALLQAAFRLAQGKILPLERAWDLVSRNPARAAGLKDRGRIATGCRADLLAIATPPGMPPHVIATWRQGRPVFGPLLHGAEGASGR